MELDNTAPQSPSIPCSSEARISIQSLPSAQPSPLSNPTSDGAEKDATSSGGPHESELSVVIDLRQDNTEAEYSGTRLSSVSSSGGEKACRICQVSSALPGSGSELVQLGCGCKNGLGVAHQHCAESWFKIKGNRRCEICGLYAKNITGLESRQFMGTWHGRGAVTVQNDQNSSLSEGRFSYFWKQNQLLCNIIIASLLVAFVVPWFLRVNML